MLLALLRQYVAPYRWLVAAVMALQAMMERDGTLREIEINPLILKENGAVAVDAVIWEEEP